MDKKVIIVGAGIAGVQAATGFASKGISCLLINGEDFSPYYRMRLEEVVAGATPDSIQMHPLSWYEDRKIELINGCVKSIDRDSECVILSDGRRYYYSELILAVGSHAFSFPIPGAENVTMTLRSMDDALLLRKRLSESSSIAIIGGGLLGLEAATAIKEHFDVAVSVVENQSYILSKQIDADSSAILRSELERRGIHIFEGVGASSYKDSNLILSSGDSVKADLILISAGVRANTELALDSGISVDKAIVVDSELCTSDKNIYSIGDCSQLCGHLFSLALYAREQGMYVASDHDKNTEYVPSEPSSMLKVAGIDVSFFGIKQGEKKVFESGNSRITCFVENGILVGIVLVKAKALMMKARAAVGKSFDASLFGF